MLYNRTIKGHVKYILHLLVNFPNTPLILISPLIVLRRSGSENACKNLHFWPMLNNFLKTYPYVVIVTNFLTLKIGPSRLHCRVQPQPTSPFFSQILSSEFNSNSENSLLSKFAQYFSWSLYYRLMKNLQKLRKSPFDVLKKGLIY